MSSVNTKIHTLNSKGLTEKHSTRIQTKDQRKEYKESLEKLKFSHKIMTNTLRSRAFVEQERYTTDPVVKSTEAIKSKSSSGNSSGRSIESISSPTLNLTLYGSAAPVCFQRPIPMRQNRRLPQPPNSPTDLKLKSRGLPRESTEIVTSKSSEKITMKLSHRQIKIYEKESQCVRYSHPLDKDDEFSHTKGFDYPSSETPVTSTRHIDFSIDLSSVTNTDDESESSSGEIETTNDKHFLFYNLPNKKQTPQISETTSSSWSRSPPKCIWRDNRSNKSHNSDDSWCEPSFSTRSDSDSKNVVWTSSAKKSSCSSHHSESLNTENQDDNSENGCYCKKFATEDTLFDFYCNDQVWERCQTADLVDFKFDQVSIPSQHRARSADLVCAYVKTVNNSSELSKFFRSCVSCNEPCCVCPETGRSVSNSLLSSRLTDEREPEFYFSAEKENSLEEKETNEEFKYDDKPMRLSLKTYRKEEKREELMQNESFIEVGVNQKNLSEKEEDIPNSNPVITEPTQTFSSQSNKLRSPLSSYCAEFSDFFWERRHPDVFPPEFDKSSNQNLDQLEDTKYGQLECNEQNLCTKDNVNDFEFDNREQLEVANSEDTQKSKVPISIVQLATAAQCARILADSLEALLQSVNKEMYNEVKNTFPITSEDIFKPEIKPSIEIVEKYFKKIQENNIGDILSNMCIENRDKVKQHTTSDCPESDKIPVTGTDVNIITQYEVSSTAAEEVTVDVTQQNVESTSYSHDSPNSNKSNNSMDLNRDFPRKFISQDIEEPDHFPNRCWYQSDRTPHSI